MRTLARRDWLVTLAIFVAALAVYMGTAALLGRTSSPDSAYFDQLAEAFLAGKLHLAAPRSLDDLTNYMGRWYVPFPPLPALLMLPWAAVGTVNTVLFGAIAGAANASLAFLMLQALSRRGYSGLDRGGNLWLTALFALGSVHWYMATLGSVWFLAQLCAASFVLASTLAAVSTGSPLLAGGLLGVALLGRPNLALGLPLLLGIAARQQRERPAGVTARGMLRLSALALAPMALAVAGLLWYNAARFEAPLNFGYMTQNVARELAPDLLRYGQFNLHYVGRNLQVMLLAGPQWDPAAGQYLPTIQGMSLLLTTPALIYTLRARRPGPIVWGAWIAIGLLLIPLLSYYNTGWWQFGYRFSLDFMTPALVLLALAAGQRVGWPLRLLILLGIAVNAWGAWWFLNPRFFA